MSDWSSFAAQDPFNPNFVEGEISHRSGDEYGAVLIKRVNGQPAEQLIYCTPKVAYPFDRHDNWHWPRAKRIERYEKLDGTNIFAYRYRDAGGTDHLTYKTRLLPFVQNSRFGPFLDMWREILGRYPVLNQLPWKLGANLSFELWGARNPHLVKYPVPLEASLLFGRWGRLILPPSALGVDMVPCATLRGLVSLDYVGVERREYQESQAALEQGLRPLEDGYSGVEGEVWYLLDETGAWTMFKCKPDTIEQIHWAAGGLRAEVVRATVENAFENWDEPTLAQVNELLREEFAQEDIEKAGEMIARELAAARERHLFREEVLVAYRGLGLSILTQKTEVMRALSAQFKRSEIRQVYSIVWAHATETRKEAG